MPSPEQLIRTAIVLPWAITRRVIGFGLGLLPGSGDEERYHAPSEQPPRPERTDQPVRVEARRAAADAVEREREPTEELPPIEDDLSGHIDSEVEVVAEVADAEAPDSPGPQIHVDEPWEGYGQMKAPDIVDRVGTADQATKAVVRLYEQTHRKRKSILDATGS